MLCILSVGEDEREACAGVLFFCVGVGEVGDCIVLDSEIGTVEGEDCPTAGWNKRADTHNEPQ